MDLPEAAPNETRSAPELLASLIASAETPIEVVAVGPLTNLALALEADSSLVDGLAGITIMGGAVDVPGNVMRNEVAEWNIWVDPTAAGVVFASGAPVTLVPLDATNNLPTSRIFWESLDHVAQTPAATIVRDVWANSGVWIDNPGGFYFWDELAAATLVDESLVTFETRRLVVDDETRENKGWTREDPTGTAVRVATSANRLAFEQLFLDTIVGSPAELGYIDPTLDEVEYLTSLAQIEKTATEGLDLIFEQAAAEVGSFEGDDFFEVIAASVPAVFAGPWVDRMQALTELDVPASLVALHDAYLDVLVAVDGAQTEFAGLLESNDLEALELYLDPVLDACLRLQRAVDERLLDVHLGCN
jgi:hypothetical protein